MALARLPSAHHPRQALVTQPAKKHRPLTRPTSTSTSTSISSMVRTLFVSVVALAASANAFLAPVPGYSLAQTSRASGVMQMVTSTAKVTPTTEGGKMQTSEATYTAALKKMEAECMADLEKAFDETAKKAKAESDKIWGDLEAEFAMDTDAQA